jgi:SAM-dependent methyltransferase
MVATFMAEPGGAGLRLDGELYAAAAAERLGDEIERLEAGGAKLARLRDRLAAARAQRRQKHVQHAARKCLDNTHAGQDIRAMAEINIFDRRAVRLHRERAASGVAGVADILQDAAARLLDRLDDTTHRFAQALEIGGRGVVAPMLRARGIGCVSMDLSARMAQLNGAPCLVGDEEALPFAPESFDLVVASLSLHWVNDLPGALVQLRRVLRPDGLFLASLPALGTLGALRTALASAEAALSGGASPRVSPFADLRDCAALLQRAGFALPVADSEDITLLYADPMGLVRDLRAAGETNALVQQPRGVPHRDLLPAALAGLPERDGRMEVLLRLAFMTGWAPAATQPRALKPGSAQVSLAEALRSDRL